MRFSTSNAIFSTLDVISPFQIRSRTWFISRGPDSSILYAVSNLERNSISYTVSQFRTRFQISKAIYLSRTPFLTVSTLDAILPLMTRFPHLLCYRRPSLGQTRFRTTKGALRKAILIIGISYQPLYAI